MSNLSEQVEKRARELLPPDENITLSPEFISQCLNNNEMGDGMLFAALNRKNFLYNVSVKDGQWYVWRGHYWAVDEKNEAIKAVFELAQEYKTEANALASEINEKGIDKKSDEAWKIPLCREYKSRFQRLLSQNGALKTLFSAPIVCPEMAKREDEFDKKPWLLPVKNGVINLHTGVLESGRQEDLLTRVIDIEYDPHADFSEWQKIVDEITGDPEISSFLKRSFGYAITGFSNEQFIWVFIGPGRNGKGVLFSMLSDVLGPYYHELSPGMIIEQKNEPSPGAASEHKYALLGKRLIVGAETNKGQKIDARAVKTITGDDIIVCRPNFRSEINFRPSHSLFLHTNHMPYGLTKEFSLLQRLLLIKFPYMYVDDIERESKKEPGKAKFFRKKDPNLKEKLKKYRKGILTWLVQGTQEYLQRGLDPPKSILDNIDVLFKEEDVIGNFIDQCLVFDPQNAKIKMKCTEMYDAFRWWWEENKSDDSKRRPSMNTINNSLRDMGTKVEPSGGRTWIYGYFLNFEVADDVKKFVANGYRRVYAKS